ncbi:MAG: hypothetical protein WC553_01740 [Patescibacteria group bacterium]|jgi:hypothetical protein
MGDANTPPRLTKKEKQARYLAWLNRSAEAKELRRRLRKTVASWLAELPSDEQRKEAAVLIQARYNFDELPESHLYPLADLEHSLSA